MVRVRVTCSLNMKAWFKDVDYAVVPHPGYWIRAGKVEGVVRVMSLLPEPHDVFANTPPSIIASIDVDSRLSEDDLRIDGFKDGWKLDP